MARLSELPNETTLQVLSYLGPRDLTNFGRTSRLHTALANDESLWRPHYEAALADTFENVPEIRVALRRSGLPGITTERKVAKDGLRALCRINTSQIRLSMDAATRRGETTLALLANPATVHLLQAAYTLLDFPLGVGLLHVHIVKQLVLEWGLSPAAGDILATGAQTLRWLGGSPATGRVERWGRIARGTLVLLAATKTGVGWFLDANTAQIQAEIYGVPAPQTQWVRGVAAGVAVGLFEICASERLRSRILDGAGQRSLDFVGRAVYGSPWTSFGQQVRKQANQVADVLPNWVVQDAMRLDMSREANCCNIDSK